MNKYKIRVTRAQISNDLLQKACKYFHIALQLVTQARISLSHIKEIKNMLNIVKSGPHKFTTNKKKTIKRIED